MDELQLVKRCLDGDEKSCKCLFDKYASQMLALCIRYSDNRTDAEDCLQDGFIKVFQNLNSWKSTGPLGAWIRRIMINTCLTKQTSAYNQHIQSSEDIPEKYVEPEIVSQLGMIELESLIAQMPSGYRTIFNMSIMEGYSYEEISSMLNVTESTCRSQLFKAKNYLAKRIEVLYPNYKYSL